MNIKELETRTGLARANIRFYESEGLLNPSRLPNGYRDYSEEDLITLEKIKLLRELGVEISTIRLVQQGSLTLQQVLFGQLNRMEGDQVLLERQKAVCQALQSSGAEYGALEPEPWLARLAATPKPSLPPKAEDPDPEQEEKKCVEPPAPSETYEPAAYHPWRRYFARSLDITLWELLLFTLPKCFLNCFSSSPVTFSLPEILRDVLLFIFALWSEAWLISHVGWTFGKWVFGLELRTKTGEKPNYEEMRHRCFEVARYGYGFYLPIYNLYRLWKSYRCVADGDTPEWDAFSERRYKLAERRGGCATGAACYLVITILAATISILQPSVFWMSRLYRLPDLKTVQGIYASSTQLKAPEYPSNTVGIYLSPSTVEDEAIATDVTFAEQPDGRVSATITKHFERDAFSTTYRQESNAIRALFGWEIQEFYVDDAWTDLFDVFEQNYDMSVTYYSVHIEQKVESSDYYYYGPAMGFQPDGENPTYTRTVTITWSGDVLSWFLPLRK